MYTSDVTQDLIGRYFFGTVVAVSNPGTTINGTISQTYKLQVRIPVLHQGLSDAQLPYCSIIRSVFRGAASNVGEFVIPVVGTQVVIVFDGGDNKTPIVIGEIYSGNVQVETGIFTDPTEWGWVDNFNNQFIVDANGNITLNAKNDITINSPNDNINAVAKNNITIHGKQQVTLQTDSCSIVMDNNKITITGNTEIDINAPTIKLTGTTEIDLTAPTINIGNLASTVKINTKLWTLHTHPANIVPPATIPGTIKDGNNLPCTGSTGSALT